MQTLKNWPDNCEGHLRRPPSEKLDVRGKVLNRTIEEVKGDNKIGLQLRNSRSIVCRTKYTSFILESAISQSPSFRCCFENPIFFGLPQSHEIYLWPYVNPVAFLCPVSDGGD